MSDKKSTTDESLRIDFGRHSGERLTRVPVSYLFWMVNSLDESRNNSHWIPLAKAELERRGSVLPAIDLSGHAINRVSLRCLDIWQRTRQEDEGLHAWLHRISLEALEKGEIPKGKSDIRLYLGMKIAYAFGSEYPAVVTVMRTEDDQE